MQVRKQQLDLYMEQQTGSRQEKEYVKAVYCHPAYLLSLETVCTVLTEMYFLEHLLSKRTSMSGVFIATAFNQYISRGEK